MEVDVKNLRVDILANLDNPIKGYDFDVMSQQYNSLMELQTDFTKFDFSWKYILPLLLYLEILGLRWFCMHLWLKFIN